MRGEDKSVGRSNPLLGLLGAIGGTLRRWHNYGPKSDHKQAPKPANVPQTARIRATAPEKYPGQRTRYLLGANSDLGRAMRKRLRERE